MKNGMRQLFLIAIVSSAAVMPNDRHALAQRSPDPDRNGRLSSDNASAYVGRYKQENVQGDVRIVHRGGYLSVLLPGRPPIRMLHSANHTFTPEHLEDARVVFRLKDGKATGYTFRHSDGAVEGRRIAGPPEAGDLTCEPVTLTTGDRTEIDVERCALFVRENRSKPTSNVIELRFARLISKAAKPKAPLVYLHGGPGSQAVNQVRNAGALKRWEPFLKTADVILLDQRGCGASSPRLYWTPDAPPVELFGNEDTARSYMVDACRRAAHYFRDRGVDLEGYTTQESADDLNDLRIALGVEKISLLGFSYGTHLAQAAIRRHGGHIERAVICGVEGLDMTYKYPLNMDVQFQKLALMAQRDPAVSSYIPDLTALLRRVFEKLERDPMTIEATDPSTGAPIPVPVGKFGLQLIFRLDMGDATDLPVFPRLLYSIDKGDPSVLRWFVQKRLSMFRGVNLLTWVMDGASGGAPYRWERIRAEAKQSLFGNVMNFPYPDVSRLFGNIVLGDAFRAPLVSDVPTLFLSGSLDWNTPPYQAERVRWGFTDSTHLIVENAGHEQVLTQPEIQTAVQRFLRGEDIRNASLALPPLQFVPIEGVDPSISHPSVTH